MRVGHGVHHAHPGAGRHRPVRRRPDRDCTSAATTRSPGVPVERILALGAEDYPGGEPASSTWRSWACGSAPARQRRLAAARRGQPAHVRRAVAGLRRPEVPITQHHQRRARADLGGPQGLRAGRAKHLGTTDDRGDAWDRHRRGPRRARSGRPSASCAQQLVMEARRRVRSSWLKRGRSRGRAGLDRRHPRPRRPDHRLRPAGADVQAAHPDAARPGAAQGAAAATRSGRCSSSSPASRTRPTTTGKKLIQQMVKFADDPEVRHRIVFLPNYDIAMAQYLYPGCDVWLNNPLRPFEACGTSGMKAALNGGLNLSILDGWWDEWFDGENGWAIPTADGVEDPDRRDDLEAAALYDLIETRWRRGSTTATTTGCRTRWLSRWSRHTLSTLGPKVLATPDGARLRRAALRPGGRAPGGRSTARSTPAPSDLAAWKAEVRGAWPARAGRPRRVLRVSATHRRSATRCTCGRSSTWAGCRPGDVEVQVVHGRVASRRDLQRPSDGAADATPRPTRAGGTGSRATCGSAAPARSATRSRVLPRHSGWPAAPSWAWSPTPAAASPHGPCAAVPTRRGSCRVHGGGKLRSVRAAASRASRRRRGQRLRGVAPGASRGRPGWRPRRAGRRRRPGPAARRRCPEQVVRRRAGRGAGSGTMRRRHGVAVEDAVSEGRPARTPSRYMAERSAVGSSQRPVVHRLAVGARTRRGRSVPSA